MQYIINLSNRPSKQIKQNMSITPNKPNLPNTQSTPGTSKKPNTPQNTKYNNMQICQI